MTYNPNFSSGQPAPASKTIQISEENNTGSTIVKATPVRIVPAGGISTVDISEEAEALAVAGLVAEDVANGASANIVNSGRIENISTGASVGAPLYISKSGYLTDVKPTLGADDFSSGDFVIQVGVVAKNSSNPANKDILVTIRIMGQL